MNNSEQSCQIDLGLATNTLYPAFIVNQNLSSVNMTSVVFLQSSPLTYLPVIVIAYRGNVTLREIQMRFAIKVITKDFLFFMSSGVFSWSNSLIK